MTRAQELFLKDFSNSPIKDSYRELPMGLFWQLVESEKVTMFAQTSPFVNNYKASFYYNDELYVYYDVCYKPEGSEDLARDSFCCKARTGNLLLQIS